MISKFCILAFDSLLADSLLADSLLADSLVVIPEDVSKSAFGINTATVTAIGDAGFD